MQSQVLTELIKKSSAGLAQATTELGDKATWKPLDKGRSAVDQCVECGYVSMLIAGALDTQGMPAFDRDGMNAAKAENGHAGESACHSCFRHGDSSCCDSRVSRRSVGYRSVSTSLGTP